jgi:hypothetical protein
MLFARGFVSTNWAATSRLLGPPFARSSLQPFRKAIFRGHEPWNPAAQDAGQAVWRQTRPAFASARAGSAHRRASRASRHPGKTSHVQWRQRISPKAYGAEPGKPRRRDRLVRCGSGPRNRLIERSDGIMEGDPKRPFGKPAGPVWASVLAWHPRGESPGGPWMTTRGMQKVPAELMRAAARSAQWRRTLNCRPAERTHLGVSHAARVVRETTPHLDSKQPEAICVPNESLR